MKKIVISYGNIDTAPLSTNEERGAVCTIGHFDGVHLGHQHVIRRMQLLAQERGLKETIAVTFDRHPRTIFDPDFEPKMLSTLEERTHLLSLTGINTCAILQFDAKMAAITARDFMEKILRDKLGVRVLVLGYDNRFGKRNAEEGFDDYVRYGKELGIEVVECDKMVINTDETVSSTHIRNLLTDGYVNEAMRCFGRPYTLEGTVVEGYQEGRKIGFPTANIAVDKQKVIPESGVYAVKVRVEGCMTSLHGMMNIGNRPTYGNYNRTLETHIFRFTDNIYGKKLRIEFYKRLRNEQQFPSAQRLAEQLREDARMAEETLNL